MAVCFEDVCDNPDAITTVEAALLVPFTRPAVEVLRARTIDAVAAGPLRSRARAVTLRAWGTEVKAIFTSVYAPTADQLAANLCRLARLPALDAKQALVPDHQLERVMADLRALGLPQAHSDLLLDHCRSSSMAHRVAGRCATILMAAVLIVG